MSKAFITDSSKEGFSTRDQHCSRGRARQIKAKADNGGFISSIVQFKGQDMTGEETPEVFARRHKEFASLGR
jgi:hypothetical protein